MGSEDCATLPDQEGIGWAPKTAPTLLTTDFQPGRRTDAFECRQPEPVLLAGMLGMGVYDRSRIDYRWHWLKA